MNRKISELISCAVGFVAQNLGAGAKTTAYTDVSQVGRVAVHLSSADDAAGQAFTVQFKQATDAAGTGAKNLGDAIAVAAGDSGKLSVIAERVAAGLDDGFTHVAAEITDGGAAIASANATLILGEHRYNPS